MNNNTIANHQAFVDSILANNEAWKDLLQEDVYLQGPLAEVQGKEDFITLNEPYFAAIQDMKVHHSIVEGNYITTQITTTIQTHDGSTTSFEAAEWYEFKEGKIQSLKVYFDPRPLM